MIVPGDHAGISETSLMLYLDKELVDMTRIRESNFQDHGWQEHNSPENATPQKGEAYVSLIISHLKQEFKRALDSNNEQGH